MSHSLTEQPTWAVQDASKIQGYMSCPRRYFYEYVLGWRSEIPNIHFEFGTAWHLAMEVLLREGYSEEAYIKAFREFLTHYRKSFDETWDEGNAPKNPGNALRALPMYGETYQDDNFDVLHIEVAGSVAIGPNRHIHFKTDTICHGAEGYFSLEHKTSARGFTMNWASQWTQKMQVGTYNHVLYSLYEPEQVYGVKINGAFFSNPPKTKKNGDPYSGARDNTFKRVPVRRNLASMNAWLWEVNQWIDKIERDFQTLAETSENDIMMTAFPRNTERCTDYGVCPFIDRCSHWHNPLQHIDEIPIGYKEEHWDPRDPGHSKEIMKL